MGKTAFERELLRLLRERGVSPVYRRHSEHVAKLADMLFAGLPHLHGLTKPSRPIVQAAGLLHDVEADRGKAGHDERGRDTILGLTGLPLTSSQRRIIATATALHSRASDLASFEQRLRTAPDRAETELAGRLAALLRIADGLDHTRTQETRITGILDDGEALEIRVNPSPSDEQNAAFSLSKADLWNRLALRPIRAVSVQHGEVQPAALIEPALPTTEAARRVLQRQLEQLVSREYGLSYREDVEFVHEMRVATRRLRAAMRVFRKAVRGGFEGERARLREVAAVLGDTRDSDVFLAFLTDYLRQAPEAQHGFLDALIRVERRKRRQHGRRAFEMCTADPYRQSTRELYQVLRRPVGHEGGLAAVRGPDDRPVWRTARKALRRLLARAVQFGRRVDRLPPAQQHRLRIACKRVRYAAEFFTDIFPDDMQRLIKTMVRMQDLLGESHDADVYAERIRQYGRARSRRASAAGDAEAVQAILDHLGALQRRRLLAGTGLWRSFTAPKQQERVAALVESPLRS
jgi:CHAD domain-containing protein